MSVIQEADAKARSAPSKFFSIGGPACAVIILSTVLFGCRGSTEQNGSQYRVQELPGSLVEGTVRLQGTPPPAKKIQVAQDADVCGETREVFPVRVKNGGIDDAVVWIDDIQRGKAFSFPPAQVDQGDCTFFPHIVLMHPGDVKITSRDPIPHSVHTHARHNRDYDESMSPLKPDISLSFQEPDVIGVRCDLHSWMQAYVIVAKNPYYAITENGGKFKLDGVPKGHYRLKVWSENLGGSEQMIDVEEGQPTKADFELKSPTEHAAGAD